MRYLFYNVKLGLFSNKTNFVKLGMVLCLIMTEFLLMVIERFYLPNNGSPWFSYQQKKVC